MNIKKIFFFLIILSTMSYSAVNNANVITNSSIELALSKEEMYQTIINMKEENIISLNNYISWSIGIICTLIAALIVVLIDLYKKNINMNKQFEEKLILINSAVKKVEDLETKIESVAQDFENISEKFSNKFSEDIVRAFIKSEIDEIINFMDEYFIYMKHTYFDVENTSISSDNRIEYDNLHKSFEKFGKNTFVNEELKSSYNDLKSRAIKLWTDVKKDKDNNFFKEAMNEYARKRNQIKDKS